MWSSRLRSPPKNAALESKPRVSSMLSAIAAGLVCVVLVSARPAQATSAVPMSVEDRSRLAERVVLAQVLSTHTVVNDGDPRSMRTVTRVVVGEDWKGAGPSELDVEQLGGAWGLWQARIPGDARFQRGETVVLWLRCTAADRCRLLRLGEGKATVEGGVAVLFDLATGQAARQGLLKLKRRVLGLAPVPVGAPGPQKRTSR